MSTSDLSVGNRIKAHEGFHITIITSPTKDLNMYKEIEMVKAALLYADNISIYSANIAMLGKALQMGGDLSEEEKMALVINNAIRKGSEPRLISAFSEEFEKYKYLKKKKWGLTKSEESFVRMMYKRLNDEWEVNNKKYDYKVSKELGFTELIPAYELGLIDIEPIVKTDTSNDFILQLVDKIGNLVTDGRSYPLFDTYASEFISMIIRNMPMTLSDARLNHSKYAALPMEILQRLPLFPSATIEDIIDIRKDIKRYLDRFRAAMIEYSDLIKDAPWDKDFPIEAQRIFVEKIAPEVSNIEDAVKSNSYFRPLINRVLDDKVAVTSATATLSSTLSMVVSNVHNLGDIINSVTTQAGPLVAGVATGILTLDLVRQSVQQKLHQIEEKKKIEQNRVYLYYHVQKRLQDR